VEFSSEVLTVAIDNLTTFVLLFYSVFFLLV